MFINKSFEIKRTSECDVGDLVEMNVEGYPVFAVTVSAFDEKLMVGFFSTNPQFKPTIYPTTEAWDDVCFYYPNAVLQIIRTDSLIVANPAEGEMIGALRMIADTLSIRAETLARPARSYWIDLGEAQRVAQPPQGTEFFVTRWQLWSDAEHRTMLGAKPLADVTARSRAPG